VDGDVCVDGERGNEEDEEERMHKIALYKAVEFFSMETKFFVAIECDTVLHRHELGAFGCYEDAVKFADLKSVELGFPVNNTATKVKKNKRKP